MRKILFLLFNAIVLIGFSVPTDTISPLMPPRPPHNYKMASRIQLNRNETTTLTNLVIFVRFADDPEFSESLAPINQMFNDTTPYNISVYNYYNVMTYGKINYHTVYTNNIQGSTIISYQDPMPRSYYQPYSETNPGGYPPQEMSITNPRETELLGRVMRYVDSLQLVSPDVNLDGNNDGWIDNISFIIKGNVGNWADLLWPHMDFFGPDIYLNYLINGKMPHSYNFEFANSYNYFTANTFCHEMGHSLGIPDFYHYFYTNSVAPVGSWDQMAHNNLQQVSAILKYMFLGIVDEPIEIVEDGHYVLNSNTSSDHQNCYFIRSSIDPNQWYTIEYRNCDDFMENTPQSGVIIGRWYDNVDLDDMYDSGNGFFDFFEKPHTYWIFRPYSNIDTVNGYINYAAFGDGPRKSFGPTTNPHPFLIDGTPETSFEITNINYSGDQASFDVHFLNVGIDSHAMSCAHIYPNPTNGIVYISSASFDEVQLFDAYGKLLGSWHADGETMQLDLSQYTAGVYIVKVLNHDGTAEVEKVLKR